jgi:hypothetical protein
MPLTIEEVFRRTIRDEFERLHVVQRVLVDIDEVSEMYGMSVGGVRNLVAEGKLTPVDGLDSRLRFDINEVLALVKKKKK